MIDRAEGDVNLGAARRAWREGRDLHAATREGLAGDEEVFLPQSLSTPCLDVLESARGSWLVTLDGRRILDFHGNAVHHIGHGHPRVVEAVCRALGALPFSPRRFTNGFAIELGRRLANLLPDPGAKCLLVPNGSAAMGIALKLARATTGRWKTISWWDSFHGAGLDAASVGGERVFRDGMGPLLPGALHVPPPGARTRDGASIACDPEYIGYLMEKEGDIGAVVAEPFRCTTVQRPPAGYWKRVRELCDAHGARLVFDEVSLGLGRTGTMCAWELDGIAPDILVLGKSLGGGVLPQAAVVARAGLEPREDSALGHYTHEKSPVGAAAALAFLDVLEEDRLVEGAEAVGARMAERIRSLAHPTGMVGEVRQVGLLLAVDLRTDFAGAERILYRCLELGLSFKLSGGATILLQPPLNLTGAEEDFALSVLGRVLVP